MAYAQIHVDAVDHWKIGSLSAEAFRTWVVGLCYAQKHLTDGLIDRRAVRMLRAKSTQAVIGELIDAGLWHDVTEGYQIHDFAAWNRTRQQVEDQREKWRGKKRGTGVDSKGEPAGNLGGVSDLPLTDTIRYDPQRSETGERPSPRMVEHQRNLGRRTSLVPGRDPNAAYQCEAFSVPRFLHEKFRGRLANAKDADPEATLQAWYRRLRDDVEGCELSGNDVKFLTDQFDAWRKPAPVAKSDVISPDVQAWIAGGRA